MLSDDKLVLIIPSKGIKEEILQYKEEHFKSGDMQVHGSGGLAYYDDIDTWMEHINSIRKKKRICHKAIKTYFELRKTFRSYTKVIVACDKDNVASAKTAMSCGGILVMEFTDDGLVKQHYTLVLNCLL